MIQLLFLLFLFGILFAYGLYQFLADRLCLPSRATRKAMAGANKRLKPQKGSMDALLLKWAVKLSRLIHLDSYKRGRLQGTLHAANIDMTPEVYTAYSITKAAVILPAVIPCLLVLPLLAPVVMVLAILTYFKESKRADELLQEKRSHIEAELPRFVATVTQELKSSRDVLGIMEH